MSVTELPKRPDTRVQVHNYKASTEAYAAALRRASDRLGMPIAIMIETGLQLLMRAHGLPPLPPRTEGRYGG